MLAADDESGTTADLPSKACAASAEALARESSPLGALLHPFRLGDDDAIAAALKPDRGPTF